MNQHRNSAENAEDVSAFEHTIRICNAGTIVIVDEQRCSPATRAWCLFEWNHTLREYGFDGLFMTGMTAAERARIIKAIDVENSQSYSPADKAMILDRIREVHGSTDNFNLSLRLELLLEPISYSVDVKALRKRCEHMSFDLTPIVEWIGTTDSRALCIFAGAGQGKSTISAALMSSILDPKDNVVSAVHFLKYSDRHRLDPVAIIKSFAWQLAKFIPFLQLHLLDISNDPLKVQQIATISDMNLAFDMLFGYTLACFTEVPVYILIDALDEADPVEQQSSEYAGTVRAAGNLCLQLILKQLTTLPPNFRLIVTSRPDAVCGQIESIFRQSFSKPLFLKPQNIIQEFEEGRVFVYDAVFGATEGITKVPSPSLEDVYDVYMTIFDKAFANILLVDADCIRSLLGIIMASQKPLSSSMLEKMGFAAHVPLLPGFPILFFVSDHLLYVIHKSLSDWLSDPLKSKHHAVDLSRGHLVLGLNLLREVQSASNNSPPSAYCLKFAIVHLVSAGPDAFDVLDAALMNIEFWRAAFRSGYASLSIAALGKVIRSSRLTNCQLDCFRWLRQVYFRASAEPDQLEVCSLSVLPSLSPFYWSCVDLAKPPFLVDRKFSLESHESWPVGSEGELIGHTNIVSCVAFSPCGLFLASGGGGGYRCWGSKDVFDTNLIIWDASSGEILTKLQHPSKIGGVAWLPNGSQIVTSCADTIIRIWDLCSGLISKELADQSFEWNKVNFFSQLFISPDGSSMISGGCSYNAVLWDLTQGKAVKSFKHEENVVMVAVTKDFETLASSCYDGAEIGRMGYDGGSKIHLWLIGDAGNQPFMLLEGHNSSIRGLSWSPDGSFLASFAMDCVKIWKLGEKFKMHVTMLTNEARGAACVVSGVAFSPCGQYLAVRGLSSGPHIWSTAASDPKEWSLCAKLSGHVTPVAVLSWHPDSSMLATGGSSPGIGVSGGGDKTVKIWAAKRVNGKVNWNYDTTVGEALAFTSTVTAVCLSSDKRVLLSSCEDSLTACRLDTNEIVLRNSKDFDEKVLSWKDENSYLCSLALSPDGKKLASGAFEKLRVFDSSNFSDLFSLFSQKPCPVLVRRWTGGSWAGITWNGILVRSVSFSADGELVAVTGSTEGVRIFKAVGPESSKGLHLNGAHDTYVVHTSFHPTDSRILTSSDFNGKITIWDGLSASDTEMASSHAKCWTIAASFQHDPRMDMSGTEGTRFCSVWSPIGDLLATCGGRSITVNNVRITHSAAHHGTVDKEAAHHGTVNKERIPHSAAHHGAVDKASIDHSAAHHGTVNKERITHSAAHNGRKIILEPHFIIGDAHSDYIMCLSFSGDGRTLVSGSKDRNVKLFDVQSHGQLLHTLSGHKGAVMTLFYSPDGSLLVTGGEDATVLVWSPTKEVEERQRKRVEPYPVSSVEFAQNTLTTTNSKSMSRTKWDLKTGLFLWDALPSAR